jgi:hypothetical protein
MSIPIKAIIVSLENSKFVICQFNPKELKYTKSNSWTEADTMTKNSSLLSFSGGAPSELTLELLFDTTSGGDVRIYTHSLLNMMRIDKNNKQGTQFGEPPRVRFIWGTNFSFEAVITNIALSFKMFRADGTPVRATAQVTFKESKDDNQFLLQNPTSRSKARRVWIVVEGQTLSWIAHKAYGEAKYWRHLAKENGITNPMALRPGQVLNIVPLS